MAGKMVQTKVTDPIGTKPGLMTWTYSNSDIAIVVTADNIELAMEIVQSALDVRQIDRKVKPEYLIPLPTHHRHMRTLYDKDTA